MAKLKKPKKAEPIEKPTFDSGRAASHDTALMMMAIDSSGRPGRDDPERDRRWLEMRRTIDRAAMGGRFDPRRMILLEGAALAQWQNARREWALSLLNGK